MVPKWLQWAQRMQAIAQNGLQYTQNTFDKLRYRDMQQLAAEVLAAYASGELPEVAEMLALERGHATPKICVRGAVFRNNQILMVRERSDGKWTLPGGWCDVNESASESVVKEVREESGFLTRAVKLAALYDRNKHPHPPHPFHVYKLFFICEIIGGKPAHGLETDGVGFFAENGLPALSSGRVLASQIRRMFEHRREPNLPADFD